MANTLDTRFKVGVRLPDWISGYASRLFEGFLDFQRTGAALELQFDQPTGGDIPPCVIDGQWKGDGLIVYRYSADEAKAWHEAGISVVNLSAEIPDDGEGFPRVTVDNEALGKRAYEYLASLGLRDFVYMHESTRLYSELRLDGFRACVDEFGGNFHLLDVPASSYAPDLRPMEIEKCLTDQLLALPKPCGIFLKDDIAGVWTSRLITKLGLECPGQIALLGVSDDIVFCHTTQPPLSSIPYPGSKIGFEALRLLDEMMRGRVVANEYWLTLPPGQVVTRESTSYVTLSDALVTDGLRYLRSVVSSRAVSVIELSEKLGVSREGLRLRFTKALGHSPKKEIERLRSQVVIKRLRETEDTLEKIAIDLDFTGPDEICRYIKRQTGKTPGSIRKEESI